MFISILMKNSRIYRPFNRKISRLKYLIFDVRIYLIIQPIYYYIIDTFLLRNAYWFPFACNTNFKVLVFIICPQSCVYLYLLTYPDNQLYGVSHDSTNKPFLCLCMHSILSGMTFSVQLVWPTLNINTLPPRLLQ